jgi:16S rRNA (guanine527-N7)-methyltransferase
LVRPDVEVTLAESQNKKASFLREAVRTLGVAAEVWGARAEDLPLGRRFDVITLRAVDHTEAALQVARDRLNAGGSILHLTTGSGGEGRIQLPGTASGVVEITRS